MEIIHKLFKEFPLTCIYSTQRIDCTRGAPGYKENQREICEAAGIDWNSLVFAGQQHGAKVNIVSAADKGRLVQGCDGLITRERNLPLAILTADCLPLFLYDPESNCIGIGHAGWQGTKSGIAGELVRSIEREFGSSASHLHAGFGPCIRACCYEVGDVFRSYFARSLVTRDKKHFLDLARENRRQLKECGVEACRIFDSGICTSCSSDAFFSYRREGGMAGRTLSIIEIKTDSGMGGKVVSS